jgi:RNA methyltransferase, TrmH family
MNDKLITSRNNALVKRARAVRDGKHRDLIFIEGVRLCEEAARAHLSIQVALYTERLARDERGERLLRALGDLGERKAIVTEQVLASVSDTKTPQGIVVLASRPAGEGGWGLRIREEGELNEPSSHLPQPLPPNSHSPLIVIMHRINNPANAGAILRAAEAAGAVGAVTTEGSADLFSPKALRGAMGSTFRLPLWEGARFSDALAWCARYGIRTVSTTAATSSARAHTEIDWTQARALVVGEEGAGLEQDEIAATDEAVRIPMRAPVESLNVAVATAIILYEAARQRGFPESGKRKQGTERTREEPDIDP